MLNEALRYRISTSLKVNTALYNAYISRDHQTSKIQLYAISATALWAYDYLLTLKDEVTELYDDNDPERDLITSCRSVTRGKRRAFSVREPSSFF